MSIRDIDSICYGCVQMLPTPGAVCPHCGWDNSVRRVEWGRLPAMTLKGGRFFIGRPLGAGGFGVTYLGRDLMAGEYEDARRAIKEFFPAGMAIRGGDGLAVLPMGAELAERFRRRREKARNEGGRMARIGSQVSNVVRACDCFDENNTIYTVMEYIHGDTLADIVNRDGPMSWQEAFERLGPVLEALRKMHALGIYHMDISPENIMFRRMPDGSRGEPVILDFGASIEGGAADVTRSQSSMTVRDGYTPPEQYVMSRDRAVDEARMDEYAICATMYFAITGVAPTSSLARQIGEKVVPLSSYDRQMPAYFESAINRGMSLKVEDRYVSMEALMEALSGIAKKQGMSWGKVAVVSASICAAGIIVALAIGGLIHDGGGGTDPTAPPAVVTETPSPTPPPAVVTESPSPTPPPTSGGTALPKPQQIALELSLSGCETAGNGQAPRAVDDFVTACWTASPNGDALKYAAYLFGPDGGRTTLTVIGNSAEIPVKGLDEGVYTVRVTAWNSMNPEMPSGEESIRFAVAAPEATPTPTPAPFVYLDGRLAVKDTGFPALARSVEAYTDGVSAVNKEDLSNTPAMNHPTARRRDIGSVTFLPSLTDAPSGAWDVSERGDGSVMAWLTPNAELYDLSIAGEGGVKLTDPQGDSCLFAGYVNVESIDFNGCVDLSGRGDLSHLFDFCERLRRVNLSGVSTASATDMSCMFDKCQSLEALDVSSFDTSRVTTMSAMFSGCKRLRALDLSGFNTARVTDMSGMFSYCQSLEALDVSGFDTSAVKDMNWMFYGCGSLTALDVRGFDTSNVKDMHSMFTDCERLEALDVSGFDLSQTTDMRWMFKNCRALRGIGCDPGTFQKGDTDDMYKNCNALEGL